MKSLEVIEQAKYEVTERAATVVVNIETSAVSVGRGLTGEGKRVRTAGSTAATRRCE